MNRRKTASKTKLKELHTHVKLKERVSVLIKLAVFQSSGGANKDNPALVK